MIASSLRVGVDLVDVNQVRNMVEVTGESFLEAGWTDRERADCAGQAERLAARWAAKEATMKALGVGIGEISPLEVEVESSVGMAPALRLHGGAARESERLNIANWSVSLSHVESLAVAVVVGAEGSR